MINKASLALGASAVALLVAGSAHAGTLWIANLSGANENPPTGAAFTGTGFLILNDAETTATITATHNISIPITGGHIHRGTTVINGPIIFPFPAPTSPVGPLVWAIPAADVVNLKTEGLYMNFHTAVNPGGAIRDTLRRVRLAAAATTAEQLAVGNALDVSAGFTSDLDQILMTQAVASNAVKAQALSDMSLRSGRSDGRQAVDAMAGFEDALFDHVAASGAAQGFGTFALISDTFGERDAVAGEVGSEVSRPSLLAGIDNSFAGGRGGLAIGYADGRDKFEGGAGETEVKTTSVEGYFAVQGNGLTFTAVGGYGWTSVDASRGIASLGRTATAGYDATVWSAGVRVAAPMEVGKDIAFAPYAIFDAQEASIDGYSEAGAGSVGLVVPGRRVKAQAIEGGAAMAIPVGGLTAALQAGWRYGLNDGADAFVTAFQGSPVAFLTTVGESERSAAHLTAALTGTLAPNLYLSGSYRGLIGSHANAQTFEVRLTWRM